MNLRLLAYVRPGLYEFSRDGAPTKYAANYDPVEEELRGSAGDESVVAGLQSGSIRALESAGERYFALCIGTRYYAGAKLDLSRRPKELLVIFDGDPRADEADAIRNRFEDQAPLEQTLFLSCPLTRTLEYVLEQQYFEIFADKSVSRALFRQTPGKEWLSAHKPALHAFFASGAPAGAKLHLFRHVCRDPDFYDYDFAKPFKLARIAKTASLRDVCLYITSAGCTPGQEPFDPDALAAQIRALVNKHDTWVVENHELRGLIGIASSYLGLAPFDRLNGGFDNDRIVLYTLLVMSPDRELFTTLARTRAYMFLSLLNDLPGFGSYFAGRAAGKGLSLAQLKAFLSPEIREYAARMSPEAIARHLGQRASGEGHDAQVAVER